MYSEIKNFEYIKDIGEGSFGKVILIKYVKNEKLIAVKKVDLNRLQNEVDVYSYLPTHINIISLYNVAIQEDKAYISMEYAPHGDLMKYIKENEPTELDIKVIFMQLLSAVGFCHKNNICHRDIKLENILFDDSILKLADFGYACHLDNIESTQIVGTVAYIAPELFKKRPYNGAKADIWSCGVVLYTLLIGRYPFNDDMCGKQTIYNILSKRYKIPDGIYISENAKMLLDRIFTINPDERITIEGIWKSRWLNE
jgi:serine/threonine-protein kinase SRK2